MKSSQWTIIALFVWLAGFMLGYRVSTNTGSEPGYFEAVEAAGYGGGSEKIEGVTEEMQKYYEELLQD